MGEGNLDNPVSDLTYEKSGVSIQAQDDAIAAFKPLIERTFGKEVLAGVGAFGAAYAPQLGGMAEPVLVSSTDSVGTKTLLHVRFNTHEWAGRDLVGCVVNDVICSGAKPIFMLDYIGLHKVEPARMKEIVGGIAAGCEEIGCTLIGGEIAEMRDLYQPHEFDLAGFAVGLVDRKNMLTGSGIVAGDVLIGLASSGVHCNGFSLARKALAGMSDSEFLASSTELGGSLKQVLLTPTRCYANIMTQLRAQGLPKVAAHISGGGLIDNVPRVIPSGLQAAVFRNRISVPLVFDIIRRQGFITDDEMWHVFNMGIGFVIVVGANEADQVVDFVKERNFGATVIGEVVKAHGDQRFTWAE